MKPVTEYTLFGKPVPERYEDTFFLEDSLGLLPQKLCHKSTRTTDVNVPKLVSYQEIVFTVTKSTIEVVFTTKETQ